MAPEPIEDYAIIGDGHTAALVSRRGSIDWLCLPRFDSPACFAALLGTFEHGRWLIEPTDPDAEASRRYLPGTTVLETTWTTRRGEVVVTDSMPDHDIHADVVRTVRGVRGTVDMAMEWVVRPGYGAIIPWVNRSREHGVGMLTAIAGPDRLVLRGPWLPTADGPHHRGTFTVSPGDEGTWTTTWSPSWTDLPAVEPVPHEVGHDRERAWAERAPTTLPHRELVVRSLLTLRLLTHAESGGIVAAPTASLPEDFGGERNWDYRFCWLRDSALTIEALLGAGYVDESRAWRDWLLRAVAGDPADLQIMYGVDGGRDLPERTLDHLPGYRGSRPVRIGNAAVDQRQNDVLGQAMIALDLARDSGVHETASSWSLQRHLVEELTGHWRLPDHGLWEVRGPLQHFTHSKLMCWAAYDRAIRAVERHGLRGPVDRWRRERDAVRHDILDHGWDAERGTFVQHYGTSEVDAALLVMPLIGFLPGDDPRVLGTIRAIEDDLLRDGLLMRYRTTSGVDGLSGDEHPFLACSFWLVQAYARAGRRDDARALFDRLCALTNDVGLLSEEYDPHRGRFVGNFPQAFSHLALVLAALDLAD